MGLVFVNRLNEETSLDYYKGESIADVLTRNHIPISSVLTTHNNIPISENALIEDNEEYISALIEGYDIDSILKNVYTREQIQANYIKNRITFNLDGSLLTEHIPMSVDDVVSMVEENIQFAIQNYNMISKGERVLIGLSGGVDSSSLLIALNKLSIKMGFSVVAATFEDFDSIASPAFANAAKLAQAQKVEHHLIPAQTVEQIFHLNKPIRQILPELMNTDKSHFAMYVDHHTTRRALEVFSKEISADKIVLGLHTTDLLAGMLNGLATGYSIGDMFKREVGDCTYIYPLAFIPKKELHLYYYAHMKKYAVHSYPNAWELNPKDRNYYYYLADQLQILFPGIENYVFDSHKWQLKRSTPLNFTKCNNCGSYILQQDYSPSNEDVCDVCRILKEKGYIN